MYPPQQGIAVTTRYSFLTWVYAVLKPKVFLNGYEMPAWGWGRAVYPTQPGQCHVHVYLPYFIPSRVGPADFTAIVNPGQLVELEYKAPVITFSRGSLGPPPQSCNGLGVVIAITTGILLIFALTTILLVTAR